MTSLLAYLLDPLLRWQVGRRLNCPLDAAGVRAVFESTPLPVPKGVRFTQVEMGAVAGEWAEAKVPPRATVFYLHGGGFVACSPHTHRPITGRLAALKLRVFSPSYRLAPEAPFPAAIEDALAAYQGLLAEGVAPQQLAIAGESAGAGLVMSTLLEIKRLGWALPACTILFSPWVDLTLSGETWHSNAQRDPMIRRAGSMQIIAMYLQTASPQLPLASPLYGDLAGLPPTLIHVGEREVLRADATRLAQHLKNVGVPVNLKIWPVVPHAWQMFQAVLPEARLSLEEAAEFIFAHTGSI